MSYRERDRGKLFEQLLVLLGSLGFSVIGSTPDAFAQQLAQESQVWAKVISTAGLKLK